MLKHHQSFNALVQRRRAPFLAVANHVLGRRLSPRGHVVSTAGECGARATSVDRLVALRYE